jgi:hypothetical protein
MGRGVLESNTATTSFSKGNKCFVDASRFEGVQPAGGVEG